MKNDIDSNLLIKIREIYSIFDKSNLNKIEKLNLGKMIRYLDQNPTNAEIERFKTEISQNENFFTFEEFLNLYLKNFKKKINSEEVLYEAFACLEKKEDEESKNPGMINVGELIHHLTHDGEAFNKEEEEKFRNLVLSYSNSSENINYYQLTKVLTSCFKNF